MEEVKVVEEQNAKDQDLIQGDTKSTNIQDEETMEKEQTTDEKIVSETETNLDDPISSNDETTMKAQVEEQKNDEEANTTNDMKAVEEQTESNGEVAPTVVTTDNEEKENNKGDELSEDYPPPFEPKLNSDRTHAHYKLRCYESRRRQAYGSKISSSSLYWRSFRDLINDSLEETLLAERIVSANVVALDQYAIHMKAIHDDKLTEEFEPILDVKGRNPAKTKSNPNNITINSCTSDDMEDGEKGKKFKLGALDDLPDSERFGKSGKMLDSIVQSHLVLSDRYNESATAMKKEVCDEMTNLREQLEQQVSTKKALGNAILMQLEAAEKEVVKAWAKYYKEAQKSLSTAGASEVKAIKERRKGAIFAASTSSKGAKDLVPLRGSSDLWIPELQYRMAVAFLSTCWEKCTQELSRLFASMKETECSRRQRLRELLMLFCQKKERLWTTLPSIISPVLNEFVERNMNRSEIEDDIQKNNPDKSSGHSTRGRNTEES